MRKYFQIIAISFAILFLELLLIRLVGTEIRIFAYFSNLLLLGIFVGSGIGMLTKKHFPLSVSSILLTLATLIVVLGWMTNITEMLSPLSESFFWFQSGQGALGEVIAGLILTLLLFLLIAGIFIPLGQALGRLLEDSPKIILAYSINIFASLAGMWAFQGLSILKISLFFGILAVQFLLIFLSDDRLQKNIALACFALSILIVCESFVKIKNPTVWSPYQKLTLLPLPKNEFQPEGYMLQVNNVGYMGLLDLSDAYKLSVEEKLKNEKLPASVNLSFGDQYVLPFVFKPRSEDILIVGAGGDNDVSAAVRNNVKNIDAVEIDPQIIEFGKKYHPENPYAAKSVTVYNGDGRSFFKRTDKRYDLVITGLADSHTLTSSLTNVRLDHYLYTQESFREVKNILKPDGLLFLTFDVRKDWIGGRIQKSLRTAFGHRPLVFNMQDSSFFGWGGVVFVTGLRAESSEDILARNPDLADFVKSRRLEYSENIDSLTDNWPYLYLDKPRLPQIHLWISLFLVALIILFRRLVPWQGKFRPDFFFLGAGFLLFEFQNISKTSLLFGNTWVTNLFTITFVLLFILLANLIQAKRLLSIKIIYAGLVITLLSQFFIPLSTINSLSAHNKLLWGSLFLNLPFLFSGLVFIAKLSAAPSKSAAFASNLLGAAAGGMLEILSFLFGIQSPLILSLALYVLALLPFPNLRKSLSRTGQS